MWTVPVLLFAAAADVPRAEPPRPDLLRGRWQTLNGDWEFCFDPDDDGLARGLDRPAADGFDRRIIVPYPWESRLSGIAEPETRGVAWYRRWFTVPADWRRERIHLCFGAVDWSCRVWVNGREVGGHVGGYTPFRLDVTDALVEGENSVVVRAYDPTDPHLPTGKQINWYTRTSGIWQPVWLEPVPPSHVTNLAVACTLDPAVATVTATLASPGGPATVRLVCDDPAVPPVETQVELPAGGAPVELAVAVPEPKLWHPDSPNLYEYALTVRQGGEVDSVRSYFGLRTIEAAALPDGTRGFLLNGEPIYLAGALHQVFNPEGIYTFPTDEDARFDVEYSKSVGWNFIRLHIKAVDPRLLYWADRLGLLLMCDVPNTWQHSERARAAWEQTMREQLARDMAHPSIFSWVCFNESWGIGFNDLKNQPETAAWVRDMFRLTKSLDPSRLVEDNSPCFYDHTETDINSWHFYIDQYPAARDHIAQVVSETYPGSTFNQCPGFPQGDAPLMNSEYGGVSAGGGDRDIAWCFKYLTTLLRQQPKVQGYVYTEHCDIEWEHNGFLCYDRTPKVFGYDAFVDGMTVADLQGQDFVGYDAAPVIEAAPGERIDLPLFISHYSRLEGTPLIRWRLIGWDALGNAFAGPRGTLEAAWAPATVTDAGILSVRLPEVPHVGAIGLELIVGGERVAANYVNVIAAPEPLPAAEALGARRLALRIAPNAVSGIDAPDDEGLAARLERDKIEAVGRPRFRWTVRLPEAVRGSQPTRLTFIAEAAARGGEAKLDWPARRRAEDYPQTKQGRATPSTLAVAIDGVTLGTARLADDWADARGFLSHHAYYQHGSHGERIELSLDLRGEQTLARRLADGEAVTLECYVPADADEGMGLSLYGERLGRYLLPPTLILETAADLPVPAGWSSAEPVTERSLVSRREALVPTAETGGAEWRYATTDPGDGWAAAGFDDGAWATGRGGFGTPGTPNAVLGTRWDSSDIWLRHRFTLDAPLEPGAVVTLRCYHDEDAEIYLNGERVVALRNYVTSYRDLLLTSEQKRLLVAGENLLAVHCRQTTGGQNIDVGLLILRVGE